MYSSHGSRCKKISLKKVPVQKKKKKSIKILNHKQNFQKIYLYRLGYVHNINITLLHKFGE